MHSVQCAEAIVDIYDDFVCKRRIKKSYRVGALDDQIRRQRTKTESKIISEARKGGVPTPIILDVSDYEIVMELIEGESLKNVLDENWCENVGEMTGKLHKHGIVHGDLTTSNIICSDDKVYLIDFGLSYFDQSTEARGVDVHVFFQTMKSTHMHSDEMIEAFKLGYKRVFSGADDVLKRVEEIRRRGRYL